MPSEILMESLYAPLSRGFEGALLWYNWVNLGRYYHSATRKHEGTEMAAEQRPITMTVEEYFELEQNNSGICYER
jgi:hypothetical protein